MPQSPDSIHTLIAWLIIGLLLGFGFTAGAWLFGANTQTGKIIAVVVLIILAAALILGLL